MYSIDHRDLGTPPAKSDDAVTLEIDGATVTVPEGTSVMRAAALADARIPKLCATDSLKTFGSCRLCLVEIEGAQGFPASCTTPVAAGHEGPHRSRRRSTQLRRNVVELYVSDHPLDCVGCPANGHCELQDAAAVTGVTDSRWARRQDPARRDTGRQQPLFRLQPGLSASSARAACAPATRSQGTFALTIEGRGFGSQVSASEHQPFLHPSASPAAPASRRARPGRSARSR